MRVSGPGLERGANGAVLQCEQLLAARLGKVEKLVQLVTPERTFLARCLNLDETAIAAEHEIGIDFGVAVLDLI